MSLVPECEYGLPGANLQIVNFRAHATTPIRPGKQAITLASPSCELDVSAILLLSVVDGRLTTFSDVLLRLRVVKTMEDYANGREDAA